MLRSRRRALLVAALVLAALALLSAVLDDGRPALAVVYLLFGFFLQRGGFCGASLLSSAVLFREARGLLATLLAVLVAMVGFAVLAALGWIRPNPLPLEPAAALLGGLVFGCGMVLAGGCISGSLFKAGEGRVTSMVALLGILSGIALGAGGPGSWLRMGLADLLPGSGSGPGLGDLLGVGFAPLAGGIAIAALGLWSARWLRRRPRLPSRDLDRWIRRGWSPYAAGGLIGVLGWAAYLLSQSCGRPYPLGATQAPRAVVALALDGAVWDLGLIALLIIAGSALSAWLRGEWKLRAGECSMRWIALAGGVLVGLGAEVGGGCFVGQVLSGWALLGLHSLLFGLAMVAGNWITTILYLRGLR